MSNCVCVRFHECVQVLIPHEAQQICKRIKNNCKIHCLVENVFLNCFHVRPWVFCRHLCSSTFTIGDVWYLMSFGFLFRMLVWLVFMLSVVMVMVMVMVSDMCFHCCRRLRLEGGFCTVQFVLHGSNNSSNQQTNIYAISVANKIHGTFRFACNNVVQYGSTFQFLISKIGPYLKMTDIALMSGLANVLREARK